MISDSLKEDLKKAQLEKDEIKVSTLRLLLSELNNFRIQKGIELEEKDEFSVVQRELKKRKEAAQAFRQGGREDSASKEEAEAQILSGYLPPQLSTEELTKIVENSINEVGAKSMVDCGKVIGLVMSKVRSGADGGAVSSLVKEKLS